MHIDAPSQGFFIKIFFHFFLHAFFCIMKSRSDDFIGAPASFSGAQLPTHGDVARQWRQSRIELQEEHPGSLISNRDVAKKVIQLINIFNRSLFRRSVTNDTI